MVPNIIGKHTDGVWAINTHLQHGCAHHFDFFEKKIPNGGMVLRLGYSGLHQSIGSLFDQKKYSFIITSENTRKEFQPS